MMSITNQMLMSRLLRLERIIAKQPPGGPPRPGLVWNPQSHRWIRPQQEVDQGGMSGGASPSGGTSGILAEAATTPGEWAMVYEEAHQGNDPEKLSQMAAEMEAILQDKSHPAWQMPGAEDRIRSLAQVLQWRSEGKTLDPSPPPPMDRPSLSAPAKPASQGIHGPTEGSRVRTRGGAYAYGPGTGKVGQWD